MTIERVVYSDDAVDEVRAQLLWLDGVLVWVNPIQDGTDRSLVDELLREVSSKGLWVSAHPDVILELGTKEVLYRTRDLGWGSDTDLYRSPSEFEERFPGRVARHHRIVVKQGRGNGGNGVWKVELIGREAEVGPGALVRVQDARWRDGSAEVLDLLSFMERCRQSFAWSGFLVDQAFQDRLSDGMLRCYFVHDEVGGFCQQWPKGLLDLRPGQENFEEPPRPSVMEGPDVPAYQPLRTKAENEWVPQMMELLDLKRLSLPVIWDADFLYGPKDASGEDTYVLCEINVSAVWPFPPMASDMVAAAALDRTNVARSARLGSARAANH